MLPDGSYVPYFHPQIYFNSETQSILLDLSIPNTIDLIIKLTSKGTVNYHSQQSIQSYQQSAFHKMQIHICGNEIITSADKESSSEIKLSVNQNDLKILLYMQFISSDQNRCPITEYYLSSTEQSITPLTQQTGLNLVSLIRVDNHDYLNISPGQEANQFTFYVVASTNGGVKFFKRIKVQVISKQDVFNYLPQFVLKPQDIVIEGKIEDLIEENGEKSYFMKYTYLYLVSDFENDDIIFDYSYNAFMLFYQADMGPFEKNGLQIKDGLVAFFFSMQAFIYQAKLYGNKINRNYEVTFQLTDSTNKVKNQFNNFTFNVIVNVDLDNLYNQYYDSQFFLQEPQNSCAQNGTIIGYENFDLYCGESIGIQCRKVCTIFEPELVLDKEQPQIKVGNFRPLLILSGEKMKMLKKNHEFLNGDSTTTELMILDCLYKYTFYKIDIKYKTKDNKEQKCPYESKTVAKDDVLSVFDKSDRSDIESSVEYQTCLIVKNFDENVECDGKTREELQEIYLNYIQKSDNIDIPTVEFLISIKDLEKQEKKKMIKEYFEIQMPKIIKVEYEHKTGYLHVHFDKEMLDEIIDERNLKLLDELKIKLSIIATDDDSKYTSHKGTRVRNFQDVQQQKMEEQEAVAFILFSWEPVRYKNKVITLKMNFENFRNVSASQQGWDKLEFIMLQQQKIQSNRFKVVSPESINKPFIVHIPPQFNDSHVKTVIKSFTQTAVLQSLVTVILNIMFGQSVQEIWAMLNSMQIVLHFGCMTIPVPGNVYFVNQQMNELLQREFYPVQEIYPKIFNFSEKGTLNPQFESMGYDSGVLIEGLGSDFINLSIICISILVSTVLTKVAVKKFQQKAYRKLGVKLHGRAGNQFISRFAQLGYLEVTITVLISVNFSSFNDFSNFSDSYSLIWTIFLGVIFLSIPFYIFWKLWGNMDKLDDYKFKFQNGWIYEDLSYLQYGKTSFYGAFYLRRLIYVVLLVYFRFYPCLQQQLHLFNSVLFLIFIGMNKPFIYRLQNKIELFNEACIILCTYCYFDFMNNAYTIDSRFTIGFVYILILALNVLINLIMIIFKYLQNSKFLVIKIKRAKLYFMEKIELFKLWCLIDSQQYNEKVKENILKAKLIVRKKGQDYLADEKNWLNYHNLDFEQEVQEEQDEQKIESKSKEYKLEEVKEEDEEQNEVYFKKPLKEEKKLTNLKEKTKFQRRLPSKVQNQKLDTIQEHPASEQSNDTDEISSLAIKQNFRKNKNYKSKKLIIKSDEEYRKLYNAPKDTLLPFSLMTFKQNPINQKIEEEKSVTYSNNTYEPEKKYIINPITQEVEEFDEQKDYVKMKQQQNQQQQRKKPINYFDLIDQKKLQQNIEACLDV